MNLIKKNVTWLNTECEKGWNLIYVHVIWIRFESINIFQAQRFACYTTFHDHACSKMSEFIKKMTLFLFIGIDHFKHTIYILERFFSIKMLCGWCHLRIK